MNGSGVCAAVLIKDEADIIEFTIRHLLAQVDHVIAVDNGSTDGTGDILRRIGSEPKKARGSLDIWEDEEVGYYQARKMTQLGRQALEEGYRWFLPCDADEYWFSPFGRIGDVLAGLEEKEPQGLFLHANLLNHLVTGQDLGVAAQPNPFTRMGYRLEKLNQLPKIACRTSPQLQIGMGNHEASTGGLVHSSLPSTITGQLVIHHFPWRSEEQFLRKITNGALAYAATNLDKTYGAHWRAFGMPDDDGFEDAVKDWYWRYGYREDPEAEHVDPLIYDPAVP